LGQLSFTLKSLPGAKIVGSPQLGQRHMMPLAMIRARVTFMGRADEAAPSGRGRTRQLARPLARMRFHP
jgi:hypothetical protein